MKQVLVLCGDIWHPAEVIKKGLEPLQDKEFHFDYVEDAKDILSKELIEQYDVIMNCKGDNLTEAKDRPWFEPNVTEVSPKDLEDYVKNGGGFLSVHSGNSFRQEKTPDYVSFVGNFFVTHPPRCTVNVEVVKEHPITEGISNFTIRDEHYQVEIVADDIDVLLESTSENGGRQVAGYVRTIGKGRLCVLTPGHILSVWHNETYQKLLCNAIKWCEGEK